MKNILCILMACLLTQMAFSQTGPYKRMSFTATSSQIRNLQSSGLDFENISKNGDYYVGEFSQEEVFIIERLARNTSVLIDDLSKYYVNRSGSIKAKSNTEPLNFQYGSMAGFLTYAEMVTQLDSMRSKFPTICSSKISIGKTIENRDIWMVKLSDDVQRDDLSEPEVLYDAMHHAREPQAMMQLIYFMWDLLESYEAGDPRATFIVNNRQLYFIPIVNPDGYVFNETTNPLGGGLWRKNRKDNGDGTFGVDLNRNYAKDWGYDDFGSSATTGSNVYRGTAAFSEPETQSMRTFTNARRFKSNFSYHSFGSYLIYPYGARENYYTLDSALYETYADSLTEINQYFSGTVFETLNYFVNGGSCDWMYGGQSEHAKIMSFTPEVGDSFDGFWPAIDRIAPIAEENLEANYFLAERCVQEIRRQVPARFTTNKTKSTIEVTCVSDGYQGSINLIATLEFLGGSGLFISAGDTLSTTAFETFSSINQSLGFAVNSSTTDSTLARIKTEFDGIVYYDTLMVLFDPTSVGLETNVKQDFILFPNPNNGTFRISLQEKSFSKIEIISMTGVSIYTIANPSVNTEIFAKLPPGVYTIKATRADHSTGIKKMIVRP